jgi:hypothetical protein
VDTFSGEPAADLRTAELAETCQRFVSRKSDGAQRVKLVEAAQEKPRWGYRGLQYKLEETGMHVNHKRVYRDAGLLIWRKRRKRLLWAGFVRPLVTRSNLDGLYKMRL